MSKVFIIAEAGVNHNGSVETAKKMIDIATEAGADAVKFQTFNAEKIISKYAKKAKYQEKTGRKDESQLEMLKRLELNEKKHRVLMKRCKEKNIIFLSSPFNLESIALLNKLGLKIFKIPSGEITNLPYLRKVGSLKKKIILSTGMSSLQEVKNALNILSKTGTKKENITVLHCNTEYPTPYKDVNLLAMITMKNALKVNVGYSDHTVGIEVPIAAVSLGAVVIEKHFTLDRRMEGPDHKMSLAPRELKQMIRAIRNIEKSLGSKIKKPSFSEIKNMKIVRKSIVAAKSIKKGGFFTVKNITPKRFSEGISPIEWDNVIGKIAKKNFKKDALIEL